MFTMVFLFGSVLAFPAGAAFAQEEDQQKQLVEKRDEKSKSAFLSKAAWITDYDKARAESKKSGKPIFAYFTRSYAH